MDEEFDFDKYYIEYLNKEWFPKVGFRTMSEYCHETARHFYELGKQHGIEEILHDRPKDPRE